MTYQTTKKRASGPKCPVTGKRIQGVSILQIHILSDLSLKLHTLFDFGLTHLIVLRLLY